MKIGNHDLNKNATYIIAELSANKTTNGLSGYLSAGTESQIVPAAAVCPDLSLLPSPWLTGQLPFKGEYEQAVIYSVLNDSPYSINTLPVLPHRIRSTSFVIVIVS